jgi:hypothetical protein
MYNTTAKENIASCPDWCYSVLLVNNRLIRVKAGVVGYYSVDEETEQTLKEKYKITNSDELADTLNAILNINPIQREAMDNGSMFGWEVPGANANYLLSIQKENACITA